VHKYIIKTEKVWQTQVITMYINEIRCHLSATLCYFSVSWYFCVCYGV